MWGCTIAGNGSLNVVVDGKQFQVDKTNVKYVSVLSVVNDHLMTNKETRLKALLQPPTLGCKQCGGDIYLKLQLQNNGESGFCIDCLAEVVDIGLDAINSEG